MRWVSSSVEAPAGVVWSATRRETGERVALKVLEPDLDPVELAAVDREESLGAQLSGAHVLTRPRPGRAR